LIVTVRPLTSAASVIAAPVTAAARYPPVTTTMAPGAVPPAATNETQDGPSARMEVAVMTVLNENKASIRLTLKAVIVADDTLHSLRTRRPDGLVTTTLAGMLV